MLHLQLLTITGQEVASPESLFDLIATARFLPAILWGRKIVLYGGLSITPTQARFPKLGEHAVEQRHGQFSDSAREGSSLFTIPTDVIPVPYVAQKGRKWGRCCPGDRWNGGTETLIH